MRARIVAAVMLVALAGCAAQAPTPTPTPTATATAPAPDILDGLTVEQKVGQLFMVGTPADQVGPEALSAVVDRHVGAIFLSGRSDAGTDATAAVVAQFTAASGTPLIVATDQEGGEIQVLSGPGFSAIPSGLEQGAMDPADLEAAASGWGSELASAGVNLDLAPVADITSGADSTNAPIASYDREFGFDAGTVETHAQAFIDGMRAAGVGTVIKHFPGLGLVEGNTDDESGVTDSTIDAQSDSVQAFATLITGGARMVMVSSAIYSRLDASGPSVFSSAIVTDLLRTKLGFDGVVLTDDLSGATQVQAWSPADRAILAIEAGADIVLVTRDPEYAAEMVDAVVAKAKDDPAFAAFVDAAARRVLGEKQG